MTNEKMYCWVINVWDIQGKDHRIGTYEINKISLSCFDDKTYIQNNGYEGLALGYKKQLSIQKSFFVKL